MAKYYPVVKWKKGERVALQNLTELQQNSIAAIIEIVDAITPDDFLNDLTGITCPVYIDTEYVEPNDTRYMFKIASRAKEKGLAVYPIFSYANILQGNIDASLFKKCLFRVPVIKSIEGPSSDDIFAQIDKANKNEYGIIIDLGPTVKQEYIDLQCASLQKFLHDHQSFLTKAFNTIICTSSFPEDISDISAGQERRYRRFDFAIFSSIMSDMKESSLINKLAYSDYGVSKFTDTDIDFSKMRYGILPKVKYTTLSEYIVLKGEKDYRTGIMTVSYKDLANRIISLPEYFGKDFSYGDERIYIIASGGKGTGNATNWVTYCANHHIAVLVQQISNLVDSLGIS